MNQYFFSPVSQSRRSDSSYKNYFACTAARTTVTVPTRKPQAAHDVVETTRGAFTRPNLAEKCLFDGDITGKIYLRSVPGCETPSAMQFVFERSPAEKYKGELLRIASARGVHFLEWKQVGNTRQAVVNAAAWVTVHDGHDFSARVLIRITVDESRPEAETEIELSLSADNRRYDNARALRIKVPAAGRGAIRIGQRAPLAA